MSIDNMSRHPSQIYDEFKDTKFFSRDFTPQHLEQQWTPQEIKDRLGALTDILTRLQFEKGYQPTAEQKRALRVAEDDIQTRIDQLKTARVQSLANFKHDEGDKTDIQLLEEIQTYETFLGVLFTTDSNLFPEEVRAEAVKAEHDQNITRGRELATQIIASTKEAEAALEEVDHPVPPAPARDIDTVDVRGLRDMVRESSKVIMSLQAEGVTPEEQPVIDRLNFVATPAEAAIKRWESANNTKRDSEAAAYLTPTDADFNSLKTRLEAVGARGIKPGVVELTIFQNEQIDLYQDLDDLITAAEGTVPQPLFLDQLRAQVDNRKNEIDNLFIFADQTEILGLVAEYRDMTQTGIEELIPQVGLNFLKNVRSQFEILSKTASAPADLDEILKKLQSAIFKGDQLPIWRNTSYEELLNYYLTLNKLDEQEPKNIYNELTGDRLKYIKNEQLRRYYLVKVFLYQLEFFGYSGATPTFSTYLKEVIGQMEKANVTMENLAEAVFFYHVEEDPKTPFEVLKNVDQFEVNEEAIDIWNYVVKRVRGVDENGDANIPDPADPTDRDFNYTNISGTVAGLFRDHLMYKYRDAFQAKYAGREEQRQMFLKTVITYCVDMGSKSLGYIRPLALETTRSHGQPFVSSTEKFEDEIGTIHNPIAKMFYDARRYGNEIVTSSIFSIMIDMHEAMHRWNTPTEIEIDKAERAYRAETNPTDKEKLRLKWVKMQEDRDKDLEEQEDNAHLVADYYRIFFHSLDGNLPRFVKDSRAIFTFDLQKKIADEELVRADVLAGRTSLDEYKRLIARGEIVRADAENGLTSQEINNRLGRGRTALGQLNSGAITPNQFNDMYLNGEILEEPVTPGDVNREVMRQLSMGKIDLEGSIVPIQGEYPINAVKDYERRKEKLKTKFRVGNPAQTPAEKENYKKACQAAYSQVFDPLNASNINLVLERSKRFWDTFREPAKGSMSAHDVEAAFKDWRSEVLGKMKLAPGKHTLIMGPFTVFYLHLLLNRFELGGQSHETTLLLDKMLNDFKSGGGVDGIPDLTDYIISNFYPSGVIPAPPVEGINPVDKRRKPIRSIGRTGNDYDKEKTDYLWHVYAHHKGVKVGSLRRATQGKPKHDSGTEMRFTAPWVGDGGHTSVASQDTSGNKSEKH